MPTTSPDPLELAVNVASILGIATALFGAWWQVRRFNKQKADERNSALRTSLLDLRVNAMHLFYIAMRPAIADVAVITTAELRDALAYLRTKEEVLEFLHDHESRNFLFGLLTSGLNKSTVRRELLRRSDELKLLPARHQSELPLVTVIINECINLTTDAIEYCTSTKLYESLIGEPTFHQALRDRSEKIESEEINKLFSVVAELFLRRTQERMDIHAYPIADASTKIILAVVRSVLSKKPSDLKKLKKFDQKKYYGRVINDDTLMNLLISFDALESRFEDCGYEVHVEIRRIADVLYDEDTLTRRLEKYPSLNIATGARRLSNSSPHETEVRPYVRYD